MATVLIIESEVNHLRLYKKELEKEGYGVVVSSDGTDALALVEAQRPDLIILDLCLSEIDGWDLMSRLLARSPQPRIIINTAYRAYREDLLSWCADAYIIKSCDLSELKSAVRSAVLKARTSLGLAGSSTPHVHSAR